MKSYSTLHTPRVRRKISCSMSNRPSKERMTTSTSRYSWKCGKMKVMVRNSKRYWVALVGPTLARLAHKKTHSALYVIAAIMRMKTWSCSAATATYLCIRAATVLSNCLKRTGFATTAWYSGWSEAWWSTAYCARRKVALWSRRIFARLTILKWESS